MSRRQKPLDDIKSNLTSRADIYLPTFNLDNLPFPHRAVPRRFSELVNAAPAVRYHPTFYIHPHIRQRAERTCFIHKDCNVPRESAMSYNYDKSGDGNL